jgi:mono/diheme cytochrome c family protein
MMFFRLILLVALTSIFAAPSAEASDPAQIARGAYIFALAGCGNCHTDRKRAGAPLAGGREIITRFGTFVTPNISSDPRFGIGGWSDADFLRALRQGVSPGGGDYYPAFPYTSYTLMTDRDILDVKAYLLSLPPRTAPEQPHRLRFPYNLRALLLPWRMLFFREGPYRPDPDRTTEWNRGAYLARAVGHCGQCHTPQNFLGAPDDSRRYGGVADGPDGMKAPDITPDPKALGDWSLADMIEFLKSGLTPDGDVAGGAMAEILKGAATLTDADRRALAIYLKSVPPLPPAAKQS